MDEEVEKLKEHAIELLNMLIEYRNSIGTVEDAQSLIEKHEVLLDEYTRIFDNYVFCMESLKQILVYAQESGNFLLENLISSIFDKLIPVPEDEE